MEDWTQPRWRMDSEQMNEDVARGWPWRFKPDEVRSNRFYITGLAKPETHKAGGGVFVEGCDLEGAIAQARDVAAKGALGLPLEDLAMLSVWAISTGNDQQTVGAGPLWYTNLPEPPTEDPRSTAVLGLLAETDSRLYTLRHEVEYLESVKGLCDYVLGQQWDAAAAVPHEDGVDLGDAGASELLKAAADVVQLTPRSPAVDRLQEAVVDAMVDLGLITRVVYPSSGGDLNQTPDQS